MSFIILFMMAYISPVEERETWEPDGGYAKLAYAAETPHDYTEAELEEPVIYLDPGHGGKGKGGSKSASGRWEAEANLALACAVREVLAAKGYRVEMTRETDVDVPLYERAREAHRVKACCFVSIHHNAPGPGRDPKTVRYRSVYGWNELARPLAEAIASSLGGVASSDGTAVAVRCLHANFAVTRSPEIPSVLVEADFITHPDGEKDAFDSAVRRRVAEAIANGIVSWLDERTDFWYNVF